MPIWCVSVSRWLLCGLFFVLVVCHAEFASAVLLVVEAILFYYLQPPFAQSSFAPVLFPPCHVVVWFHSPLSGGVYLFQAFPSRRGECGGHHRDAVFVGVAGCASESHLEAASAASASLRFVFQSFHVSQPFVVAVVVVDDCKSERVGVSGAFVFSDEIFFKRVDVRV